MTSEPELTEEDQKSWILIRKALNFYYENFRESIPCLTVINYIEKTQQALQENPKLKDQLEIWREKYSELLNHKAISGKDEEQDMKIIRSSIQDTIVLLNKFKSCYEKTPSYVQRWNEVEPIFNAELSRRVEELKAENEELKKQIQELEDWEK